MLLQKTSVFSITKKILKYLPEKLVVLFGIYLFTMQAESTERSRSLNQGDTIEFSGYQWVLKDSYGKHTGPGNNYFSGSKDNVYLDINGRLHLRVTYRNDNWYCPEIRMLKSLGFGRYYFYVDPLPQPLDKDIVIGLFLYDRDDTSNYHKEIDIEISKWGKDSTVNTQYVIQPKEEGAHRFQTDLNIRSKHLIELRRNKVVFRSFYDNPDAGDIPHEYARSKAKPDYNYTSNNEKVSLNVWLYHTSEPSNLKEFEVVISRFEFKQFWYDRLLHLNKNTTEE
jgi:hypothetical protein